MRFTIYTRQTNGFEQVVLEDTLTQAQAILLPGFGAMLHALNVQTRDGLFNVIDHYDNLEELRGELGESYKSCKLSPFACRLPEGKFTYNGRLLELENKYIDGSAIHGLLYDKPFRLTGSFCDDLQATVQFKYKYKKEDRGYPFQYGCEIHYMLLKDNELLVSTIITNSDVTEIPLCDGWHPYFKLGGKIDGWLLRFNADTIVEFDENLVPTGQLSPYGLFKEERLIKDAILDNCFVLNGEPADPACTLMNPDIGVAVSLFPDHSYPYLQIYTPPHRESIAIENLSGAPDCFNNKMGLILLPPGQSKTFTIRYQISMK